MLHTPNRTILPRFGPAVWWTAGTAIVLAALYAVAPRMGTDLAAQQARADFFAAHGWAPVDFSWYGGVDQFGYSLITAELGAWLGVRLLGAVFAVVSALVFLRLLRLGGARRPLLGGLLGAAVFTGNLVSGRITFAVGLAFGLLALAATGLSGARWCRVAAIVVGAVLATWSSPVAGLFTGLAGAALLAEAATDGLRLRRPRPYWPEAVALAVSPVVALAPVLLFGDGGTQPFGAEAMRMHIVLALLVVLVVPARHRALRIGGVLTVALLLIAYYLPSPIGSNALRLPLLFAVPLVAAFANLSTPVVTAVLVAACWWQPPIVISDLGRIGARPTEPAFFQPLIVQLATRVPARVEVVPLRDHWEAAYVAAAVPLARGWERQVDTVRNPLFYRDRLDPAEYRAWLRTNAVAYVAVAPAAATDPWGTAEAALVLAGDPGLTLVWQDPTWRLYRVVDPLPLADPPATLVTSARGGVTLDVPAAGTVLVRVRYSRWLTVRGAQPTQLASDADGWTRLTVPTAGRYRLTSSW